MAPGTGDAAPLERTFSSPGGRRWTASLVLYRRPADQESIVVLRFRAADVTLELRQFPDDWSDRTDEELVELLRGAQPPAHPHFRP